MLEDLAYLAVPRNVRGDNPSSAENQQERLVDSRSESSETMRQTSRSRDEDMVPTAWRHAGMVIKEKPSACLDQAARLRAKFLVGQVPTRTNGVTSWALSRTDTRRNCNTCEDTGYPRQDGKTPWSFTTPWHCAGV